MRRRMGRRRRLLRILLTAATVMSLVLFVAVMVAWALSYRAYHRVQRGTPTRAAISSVERGRVVLVVIRPHEGDEFLNDLGWAYSSEPLGGTTMTSWLKPGADAWRMAGLIYQPEIQADLHQIVHARVWVVPLWIPALAAGALPGLWCARRWRRWRRTRSGLCPACGYDLRATPGRCPECGTVPTAAPPAR